MRTGIRSFFLMCCFLLSMLSQLHADDSSAVSSFANWTWSADASTSVVFNLKASSWTTGYSFSIVGKDGQEIELITKADSSADLTISGSGTAYTVSDGISTIDLDSSGGKAFFKFNFSNGATENLNYTYQLFYATSEDEENYYKLSTGTNLLYTKFVTNSAAPVPIPGSALLLGSSLLGLVGISTRKKKA